MDVVTNRADSIGSVLAHPLGMWLPVIIGFALLIWINYRDRHKDGEDDGQEPGGRPRGEAAPTDTDPDQAQMPELLRLRGKVDWQEGEIARLQERLNERDGDRLRFKELVTDAYTEGTELRESKPCEDDARKWADQARNLLEASLVFRQD